MQTWTEQDFDKLSWHDCHVYAWAIVEGEHGHGTLTFDLDFITAWEKSSDESPALTFRVAPATLVFFDVFGLVLEVDYTGYGMGPFSVHGIDRALHVNEAGYRTCSYSIEINHPQGRIRFDGDRFRLTLRAEPIHTQNQHLDSTQRASLIDGG